MKELILTFNNKTINVSSGQLLRKQAEELNWEGISIPDTFKDINKFEEQNKGISVNVFG